MHDSEHPYSSNHFHVAISLLAAKRICGRESRLARQTPCVLPGRVPHRCQTLESRGLRSPHPTQFRFCLGIQLLPSRIEGLVGEHEQFETAAHLQLLPFGHSSEEVEACGVRADGAAEVLGACPQPWGCMHFGAMGHSRGCVEPAVVEVSYGSQLPGGQRQHLPQGAAQQGCSGRARKAQHPACSSSPFSDG